MKLRRAFEILLVACLIVPLAVAPVYGNVESVGVSPSLLVVGEPIQFFGTVSATSLDDQIGVFVHSGSNCPSNGLIANIYTMPSNVTYTIANSTVGIYNVTLSFPVPSSSGWVVQLGFQTGLPAGPYSVGVRDVTLGTGLCRNFTVTSPVPEFSGETQTILVTLLLTLSLFSVKRKNLRQENKIKRA